MSLAPEGQPGRLASLDAFRGLAIAGMILVNNPGSWDFVYAPLRHADWFGVTPTDVVFPFFLFAVGVSMPYSLGARAASGVGRRELWLRVLKRSLVIYGLGLFMALFPDFQFATVRLVGVLARIALAYLVAATLVLFLPRRMVFALAGGAVLLYWGLLSWVPVPGFGAGDLSPEGNLAAYLDRLILGPHMWRGGGGVYDPEGLLSTLPAISSVLIGVYAGDVLKGDPGGAKPLIRIGGWGVGFLVLGIAWGTVFPMGKPLWTSSYVVYTSGLAYLTLGALYWTIDVQGWRRWAKPLIVYGMNAITVFVASGLVAKVLIRWTVPGVSAPETSMYTRIYETAFASWAGPLNGSLAFAIATVLAWLAAMWVLYRERIFLKV